MVTRVVLRYVCLSDRIAFGPKRNWAQVFAVTLDSFIRHAGALPRGIFSCVLHELGEGFDVAVSFCKERRDSAICYTSGEGSDEADTLARQSNGRSSIMYYTPL